jgi:diphthine-ammonia ligase
MKVIALISGGKDSTYNMMECVKNGHKIVALVNLRPPQSESVKNELSSSSTSTSGDELVQELDSYMYQSVGNEMIELYAQAMELPLYRANITGKVLNTSLEYEPSNAGDEVEDLYRILKQVKDELESKSECTIEGVSSGAIFSTYQKNRVENICERLQMQSLAYLWHRNQAELLGDMISSGLQAILIKVACYGLDPEKHLGKTIEEIRPHMMQLEQQFGANVCGEGGEYETLTLDCPLFKRKRIVIDEFKLVIHSNDAFAKVGYLIFKKFHLQDK